MVVDRALRDEGGEWRDDDSLVDCLVTKINDQVRQGNDVVVQCYHVRDGADLRRRLVGTQSSTGSHRLDSGEGSVVFVYSPVALRGEITKSVSLYVGHLIEDIGILSAQVLPGMVSMKHDEATFIVTSELEGGPVRRRFAAFEPKTVLRFARL